MKTKSISFSGSFQGELPNTVNGSKRRMIKRLFKKTARNFQSDVNVVLMGEYKNSPALVKKSAWLGTGPSINFNESIDKIKSKLDTFLEWNSRYKKQPSKIKTIFQKIMKGKLK